MTSQRFNFPFRTQHSHTPTHSTDAIRFYTESIAGDPKDHTLFSNRSAAYLALGLYDPALQDAHHAIYLSPSWPKAYYRLGTAHEMLNQWNNAAQAFQKCLELDPNNEEVSGRRALALGRVERDLAARRAVAATERRSLTLKLRAARQSDQRLAMLNQFKQSMTAPPDWELEDLEWYGVLYCVMFCGG